MAISQGSTRAKTETITEPEQLGALYARLYPDLRRYAWRLTRNDADAEDLVSQAFANTLAAVGAGKVLDQPRPWLYRCVLNLALDRRRRDLPGPLGEAVEIADHHSTAEVAELNERCRAINRAAGNLPEHLRQAFVLAEVRGLDYREIAGEMHRSVSSIQSLLARARAHVRAVAGQIQSVVAPVLGWTHTVARGTDRRARGNLALRSEQIQSWLGNWPPGGAEPLGKSIAAAALVVASLVAADVGVRAITENQPRPDGGTPVAGDHPRQGPGSSSAIGSPTQGTKDGDAKGREPGRPPGKTDDREPSASSPEPGKPGESGPDSTGSSPRANSAEEGTSSKSGGNRPAISGTAVLPAPGGGGSPSTSTVTAPAPSDPFGPTTQPAPAPAPEPGPSGTPAAAPAQGGSAPSPSGLTPPAQRPKPSSIRVPPRP